MGPGLHAALTAPDIDTDSAVGTSDSEEVSECVSRCVGTSVGEEVSV